MIKNLLLVISCMAISNLNSQVGKTALRRASKAIPSLQKPKIKGPLSRNEHYLTDCFVTAKYSGGRFGDNLLAVAHALYFAQKYHCRLLLKPFKYSKQLQLDQHALKYTSRLERKFTKKITLEANSSPTNFLKCKNTLFEIPYFPEALIEHAGKAMPYFLANWEDPAFLERLRFLLAPQVALDLITPPTHCISMAVHVRYGGSFDDLTSLQAAQQPNLLYKFPLLSYYIEQIQLVSEVLSHVPIYAFIFTDALDQVALTAQISKAVNRTNVIFDCRKTENHERVNVLEDFFSLPKFDILVRSDSNFSLMAEKLGDFAMVVTPGSFKADMKVQRGQITIKKSLAALKVKYQLR